MDGVQAYKRALTKLKQITLDVLSGAKATDMVTETKPYEEAEAVRKPNPTLETEPLIPKRPCLISKEDVTIPTFQISGGTNITISMHPN